MKKALLLLFGLCLGNQLYAQPAACPAARRDLSDLTSTDRAQLRDAIYNYLRSETDPAYSSSHLRYYRNVAEHITVSGVHTTGTTIFLTWHRYYIQKLEHWLLANNYPQFVPLPSWNPSFSSMVPNEFFNVPNAIAASQYGTLNNQNPFVPGNTSYLTPAACSTTDANTFSSTMEGSYHNTVHNQIGGTMAAYHSPAATIFWPWHGYIDDLWLCYQRNCKALTSDLYIKKYDADEGATPVPSTVALWTTPDIWVRNTDDGFQNQSSQELTNTSPTDKAYVYVKVMNRGAAPNQDGTGDITAYWAQGSLGLQWPDPWTGATNINCGSGPRPLGGVIGTKPLRRVNENFWNTTKSPAVMERDYYIYEFEWDMPDPDNYTCISPEVWQQQHFCILARMNDEAGTTPTNSNLYDNLTNSNNIALRNITILKDGVGTASGVNLSGSILWGNYTSAALQNIKLVVRFDSENDEKLLDIADVTLTLDNDTRAKWVDAGSKKSNVNYDANSFKVAKNNASMEGFKLQAKTVKGLKVSVKPKQGKTINKDYKFHVVQYNDGKIVGGELYIVRKASSASSLNSNLQTINMDGTHALMDGVANNYKIYPNPAQSSFVIQYAGNAEELMEVRLYDNLGRMVQENTVVHAGQSISVSDLPAGLYVVKIINQQTKAVHTQKLVISH